MKLVIKLRNKIIIAEHTRGKSKSSKLSKKLSPQPPHDNQTDVKYSNKRNMGKRVYKYIRMAAALPLIVNLELKWEGFCEGHCNKNAACIFCDCTANCNINYLIKSIEHYKYI